MHVPDSPIRKAVANPRMASEYVREEYFSKPLARIHGALIADDFEEQPIRLARLRAQDDFCLIVLDACRYDALDAVFDEFFYGSCEPTWSAVLNTFQYLRYLWPETYDYPYVTGASPVTSQQFDFSEGESADGLMAEGERLLERYCGYVPANHFKQLVEVWRASWDEELGTCPPEPVTEAAIEAANSSETTRLVAHYLQPHGPFIGDNRMLGSIEKYDADVRGGGVEAGIWAAVRNGDVSKKRLRAVYQSNLHRVLAAATELIRETDFERYVLMGDHGEALGEYDQYHHGIEHPKVRVIPWATVTDVRDDAPVMWDYSPARPTEDATTVSRLEELGYLEE